MIDTMMTDIARDTMTEAKIMTGNVTEGNGMTEGIEKGTSTVIANATALGVMMIAAPAMSHPIEGLTEDVIERKGLDDEKKNLWS
jgi:hypothetical protein